MDVRPAGDDRHEPRVRLHRVPWSVYESLVQARGDDSAPRMVYLDGELEFMSPSRHHDNISRMICQLLMAYAEISGVDMTSCGSWTQKDRIADAGLEPDECFLFGYFETDEDMPKRPDLAVEVEWSRGGIDKLDVYARLDIQEVWRWTEDRVIVYVRNAAGYAEVSRSPRFPDLDPGLVARLSVSRNHTHTLREFRATLLAPSGS